MASSIEMSNQRTYSSRWAPNQHMWSLSPFCGGNSIHLQLVSLKDSVLKLADFGSCKSVYSKQPYTEYISTRWWVDAHQWCQDTSKCRLHGGHIFGSLVYCWVTLPEDMFLLLGCRYRAPECLLTDGYYSYKMDMWSVGCVMYEVMRSATCILQTQPTMLCTYTN